MSDDSFKKTRPFGEVSSDDSMAECLAELNPQQRAAVTTLDGHVLVVAGAGSGKTKTLAYRVAYLIANGVDPGRILLMTFTRRSAQEMIQRAMHIVERGTNAVNKVWGGTFHATANRLLRMYAKPAGMSDDFTVMDQSDAEDMINVIRQEMDLHKRDKRFPRKGTCLSIYSRCTNGTEDLKSVLDRYFPWCSEWEKELKPLFQNYVIRKQKQNVLDYDDLLLYWSELVSDEHFAKQIGGRFDHILVDEYQDTNNLQSNILKGMSEAGAHIMAVGDDAQSIYSFRAANVRNMLDFPTLFDGTTVLTLEQNYRSISPILDTTNLVIAQSKERFSKELWSTRGEGQKPRLVTCKDEFQQDEYVVKQVLEHYEAGIPLKNQAVLFRAAHHSNSLELELTRRNIPYHKYGGLRFLEAAHIKDLIAFLRVVENPRDEMAWFRVLQLLPGVGPGTASRAVAHLAEQLNDPLAIATFKGPPAAREALSGLAQLVHDLYTQKDLPPAAQVELIRTFYKPILEKNYDNSKVRTRDLENLEQIASGYRSRRRFLTDLQLDPPNSTGDLAGPPMQDEDWLVLSTIHSAKGCEWDAVFVIHAADGNLPSDMATGREEDIAEELRLTYVAMTRAKDFLYVVWPLRYYHKWHRYTDNHSYAQLCRFLTPKVRETMQLVALHQESGAEQDTTSALNGNIASRIRSRWA
ncbi:MAG: DNA helicase-2/ATP-dependent DNA helicase PcrA [Candidatus Promineifilaceae bacterium]|jgi:DNA helicase-2/ATP-dependent DNA helicase PcrA